MQKTLWAVYALLAAGVTQAEEPDWLHFSGFGTLEVDESGNRDADIHITSEESSGVGRTTGRSSGPGSIFGVQADAKLSPELTATAQVVSRQLSNGTANPYFEWANFRYQVIPNLYIRAGRLANSTFLLSESRDVGYSRLTLHLPDTYITNSITNINGGDITYNLRAGTVLYKFAAVAGSFNQSFTSKIGITHYNFDTRGASISAEFNSQTLRLSYGTGHVIAKSALLDAYHAALQPLVTAGDPNAIAVNNAVPVSDYSAAYGAISYTYDSDPVLLETELIHRSSQSLLIQEINGGYLLAGYRMGEWTPFLVYSNIRSVADINIPVVSNATLVNVINASITPRVSRTFWSAGARWDIRPNVDIKFQYDLIDKGAGDQGVFVNSTSAFIAEHRQVQVFSAALDFVF